MELERKSYEAEVKAFDVEKGVIEAIGSVFTAPDRGNERVMPGAFANMEEAQKYYSYRFLVPRWRKKARVLTDQLLHVEIMQFFGGNRDEAKRHKFDFDLRNVKALQEDQDKVHARAREDFAKGVISRGAAKRMIGEKYDPIEEEIYATTPAAQMEGAKGALVAEIEANAKARRLIAEEIGTMWDDANTD